MHNFKPIPYFSSSINQILIGDVSMHKNFDDFNCLTDAELIRLVQCQDENAFTELVSRYSPRIWNNVVQNSRQTRDAEEILMDIWLAVWQNIIGLRKVESFGAWLYKITQTACNRYYSSKSHQPEEIIMSYEDLATQIDRESEQRFHNAKLRTDAREAVHQLPQKVRHIAQMYYLDLSSVKEIAEEFNIPIGTVKSKLSETRKLLQKEFDIKPKGVQSMAQMNGAVETQNTKCKIIGVGGSGCSAVKQLLYSKSNDIITYKNSTQHEIEFYAIDTDVDSLNSCDELTRIQLGEKVSQGKGSGGSLELGRRAAAESMDEIQSIVSNTDMIFIIAGLGGGTGSAVAPIIASLARAQNTLIVCIATRPLNTEGKIREANADQGLSELQDDPNSCADAIIVVPNHITDYSHKLNLKMGELFKENSDILSDGVILILDLLLETGEITIDYDDIHELFRDKGAMSMCIGKASGEQRAKIAAQNAINSPLMQEVVNTEDTAILVNIYSPPDFTMHELDQAMRVICEQYNETKPIFGLVFKDELEHGEVIVTIISGCTDKQNPSTPSIPTRGGVKTPNRDQETSPSTDPDTVHPNQTNLYDIMLGQDQIPESVQTTIDNIAAITILPEQDQIPESVQTTIDNIAAITILPD